MYSNRYANTYFTGSQARVYVGTSLITEAVAIEGVYNVEQIPIYGYASHHFDTAATGRVFAQGSLTINYVFDGYLLAHIQKEKAVKNNTDEAVNNMVAAPKNKDGRAVNFPKDSPYYQENTLPSDMTSLDGEFYGTSDEMIQLYRDKHWAKEQKNFKEIRPEFSMGPFDIVVRDFRIGYDTNVTDISSIAEEKIFKNVFLTRYTTIRRPDASPVAEVYSFICQTFI